MAITFKEYAKEVLTNSDIPLTPQEIWDEGVKRGLDKKLKSRGATPWSTIGAQLFVDTRDNEKTPFIKVGKRLDETVQNSVSVTFSSSILSAVVSIIPAGGKILNLF